MVNRVLNNYIKKYRFNRIRKCIENNITTFDINSLKTSNGNTQEKERISITLVSKCLDKLNYSYVEAGSQQSKDFRNICDCGLNIEVKKTDQFNVFFNDTCPSTDIFYIIIFTGTNYTKKQNILPKIIFINGYDLIKDDIYLLYGKGGYKEDIEMMKNKWNRKGKKMNACKFKHMSVNPRPTYQTDIKYLL